MVSNVRARFSNGTLMPLEPIDLEEGAEVTLHIVDVVSAKMDSPASHKTEEARARLRDAPSHCDD